MDMKKAFIVATFAVIGLSSVSAQSYYDDDIYFDESKVKAKKKSTESKPVSESAGQNAAYYSNYRVADYPAADTYTVTSTGPVRDVDEYNRRGVTAQPADSASSEQSADFAYTRRLEKFHNPSIIIDSDDPELVEYYYTSAAPDVTINIGTPSYYGSYIGSYWDPWYSPSWSWGYGWNSWWGPSWSFGWNSWWGPAWGYYPYPSWGWGPAYYPGWGPAWSWAPVAPRPHRPTSPGGWQTVGPRPSHGQAVNSGGAYRPGRRPSTSNGGGYYRPSTPSSTTGNSSGSYRVGNRRTPTTNSGAGSATHSTRNSGSNYNSSGTRSNSSSQPSYSRPSRGGGGNGGFGAGRSGGGGRRR
ncbi:MAG: hypothetical protein NC117_06415 [Pseudoflavonifractor sp.]|nr:hypothetical protein [Pseudoflavonifractor sp.]